MKTIMKILAGLLALMLMVTSKTAVYAGEPPGNRQGIGISAEEISSSGQEISGAQEDAIPAEEINNDEDYIIPDQETSDEEEYMVPDEENDDVEDQTEEISEDDTAIIDEESSDEDTYYEDSDYEEESESQEVNEIYTDSMLGDSVVDVSWTSLQNRINDAAYGDIIVLDMDYTATKGKKMLVFEGKSITLDLNGHTLNRNLIAADADGSAIFVHSGASLDLINSSDREAVITGGFANNGGAINNQGTLRVENVTFKDNHASYTNSATIGCGGAIYNEGSLKMSDCIIGGDSSEESNSASDGGAIFNKASGEVELDHVVIRNNISVNHSGGGIVNYGWELIENTDISYNRSNSSNGGAIWNDTDGSMITIDCTIRGNTAKKGNGGAIFNKGWICLYCSDSDYTISENSADDCGGIYNDSTGHVDLEGVSIRNNESVSHGGGGIDNYGVLNIDGISVTDNTAKSNGGGIWSNGTINIQGKIEIKNNYSLKNTHNLYLKSGKVLTVTGKISEDSEIRLWGENIPRPVTYGWSANSGITSSEKVKSMVIFDLDLRSAIYEDGELNVLVTYLDRKWNGTRVTETEKIVPVSPKAVPSGGGKLSNGCWYAVCENETVSGMLTVPEGKEATIVLVNGRKLTTTQGIYVPAGSNTVLNIYGQSGDGGQLEAKAPDYVPGIGGKDESGHGDINFYGGTINATGGDYAAGIGSGDENESDCGTIRIYGGNITARSERDGAGIGGGNEDLGGKIVIYDGDVNASNEFNGAGIGGGDDSEYNDITIYGGNVTAQGGYCGAGIGEGCDADTTGNHIIKIYGGRIHAAGGDYAAGIGGCGGSNSSCKVLIEGGSVEAESGEFGSGIGSGGYINPIFGGGDFSGSIAINGGDVHAYARKGWMETGDILDIKYYYKGGAAIGAGDKGNVKSAAKITINGGNVEAAASFGGAAIGAGAAMACFSDGNCEGTVTINGGYVSLCLEGVLRGVHQDESIAIIGHGFNGEEDGNLYIDKEMKVWIEGKDPVSQDKRSETCQSFSNQWLHIGVK